MTYYAGQKLGNHQLVRLLGRSGFAEVYLGKHVDLDTYVAIKVLKRQTSFKALNGFLEEARIIAGLKHPHIVRILEFGIEKRCPFLVMPYLPDRTLRHRYARCVNSPAVILPYVKQIAAALHYAHERKIIHQAVKPENMLLDAADNVLLSDFGLAMRVHNSYPYMSSGDDGGTMAYMAPEQLRGKPCSASDQYALGAVMYEWLCGCPLFDGLGMMIVKQHLQTPPMPLRRHVPALSDSVERVVLKALEKEPLLRFASLQELALAFEDACEEGMGAGLLEPLRQEPSQEERLPDRVHVVASGSSQQTPLVSASLHSNTLQSEAITVANSATVSSLRPYISRRMMITGLAGIGVTLCGAFFWRVSSGANSAIPSVSQSGSAVGTLSPLHPGSTPVTRKSSTHAASSAMHRSRQKSSTSTTSTTNGPWQNSSTTSTTSSATNGDGNTSASPSLFPNTDIQPTSTPPNIDIQPTSTPDITVSPTSTPVQKATLMVRVSAKNTVKNNKTLTIQVVTNIGNIAFRVEIDYFNLKNQDNYPPSKLISSTTDDGGNASVKWSLSLSPGQIVSNTYAQLQAIATDQQGNSVSSQAMQVKIVES